MKGLKLKPILPHEEQIFIKPPELLSLAHDFDSTNNSNNYKNCTISTIEQLKDILKSKRYNRQSQIYNTEEEHEQVEKLNH